MDKTNKWRLEVYRSGKQFRWRLRAPNGRIVVPPESYKRRAGCINAVYATAVGMRKARIVDLTGRTKKK